MLAKKYRLANERGIKQVIKEGEKKKGELFDIFYRVGVGKKFVLIVPTRVSKRAVRRNRIKRLISEAIFNNIDQFPENLTMAILVKKDLADLKMGEVSLKLRSQVRKI